MLNIIFGCSVVADLSLAYAVSDYLGEAQLSKCDPT
jgi:hypothetical protein